MLILDLYNHFIHKNTQMMGFEWGLDGLIDSFSQPFYTEKKLNKIYYTDC